MPDLKAVAQEAEARADEAEVAAGIAECDAERAQTSLKRLSPCPTVAYLMGTELKGKMSQDEREWRDAEFERWAVQQEIVGLLKLEAIEAKHAAQEARDDALDAQAAAHAAAAAEEAASAAAAAQVVRMEVALEAAQEWEAEKELMLHLTKCRIAELEREERAETRTQLLAQAEKEWGIRTTPPAPLAPCTTCVDRCDYRCVYTFRVVGVDSHKSKIALPASVLTQQLIYLYFRNIVL